MRKSLAVILALIIVINTKGQNIGIGTETPDSSAVLELSSSNKGFLPPRITTAQRNAINHPAEGLQIFNTTTHCLEMYVYGRWQNVFCGVPDTTNNIDSTILTDIDGQTYPTVKICNQTWMAKNLDVARYRNGDPIPQVTDPSQWANLTTGAWCWYNNDSANGSIYGRLYNWYAVNDPRGLAPAGWHVPSDGEWNRMTKCLDETVDTTCNECYSGNTIGTQLRSITGWNIGGNGNNTSGFSGLPGGARTPNGTFSVMGSHGNWWNSTEFDAEYAWSRYMFYGNNNIFRLRNHVKTWGFSVRCVKDTPITTLNNGLVAYYPFNGNANDESGNGNNGTVNGATLTTDRFGNSGKAYSFENLDNVINIAEISPYLGSSNSSASYSIWFKGQSAYTNSYAVGVLLHSQSNPDNFDYQIRFEIGNYTYLGNGFRKKVYYRCPNENNEPVSPDEYDLNIWHHILVSVNGSTGDYNYYFDGALDSNMSFHFNPQNSYYQNNRNWQIGSYSPQPNHVSHQFYGKIDDVRIYNRALTQEEITYLAGH